MYCALTSSHCSEVVLMTQRPIKETVQSPFKCHGQPRGLQKHSDFGRDLRAPTRTLLRCYGNLTATTQRS